MRPEVGDGVVVNLHPDPRLRGAVRVRRARVGQPLATANFGGGRHFYAHLHARARVVPGGDGNELRVEGRTAHNDAYVCPGGRDGRLRLGMRPGRTYTFSVTLRLDGPLTGLLHPDSRRAVVDWVADGELVRAAARSLAAVNARGTTRLSVTYDLPATASEVWIRLVSGAARGHGAVGWSELSLTETPTLVGFFDGASADYGRHVHAWTGGADASTSTRTLRPVADAAIASRWLEQAADEEDVVDVAALLSAGLPLDGDVRRYAEALLAEVNGDLDGARRLLDGFVGLRPDLTGAQSRLATLAAGRRDWPQVVELLSPLTLDPIAEPAVFYRLARALTAVDEPDEGSRVLADGARRDASAPSLVTEALLESPGVARFSARARIWTITEARIDEIRERARVSLAAVAPARPRIFSYWAQGIQVAPPVVRACHRQLTALHGAYEVTVLGAVDIPYYVEIPAHVLDRLDGNQIHLSDVLRLELLKRYGGYWLDATCWLPGPLPELSTFLSGARFGAFRRSAARISSWFLAAENTSWVVHLLSAALAVYWDSHDELADYYLMHHLFETLVHLDKDFAREWQSSPNLDAIEAHRMLDAMVDPFDPEVFAALAAVSPVHKLTYKMRPALTTPDSLLATLVRGDATAPALGTADERG